MRYLSIILSVLFFACRSMSSYGVLSESEMQQIVWDLLRANGLAQAEILKAGKTESLLADAEKYHQVFSSHGTSHEAFLKSYNYYVTRPDRLKVIMDSVSSMATRYSDNIQKIPENTSSHGRDSAHASP